MTSPLQLEILESLRPVQTSCEANFEVICAYCRYRKP